jgi:hypothetical protein
MGTKKPETVVVTGFFGKLSFSLAQFGEIAVIKKLSEKPLFSRLSWFASVLFRLFDGSFFCFLKHCLSPKQKRYLLNSRQFLIGRAIWESTAFSSIFS